MEKFESSQFQLVRIVQDLSLARSVAKVAEIVRTAARNFANADGATFVLRDNDQCHYVDEDAISPLWKGLKFPLITCVSGWSMIHGESVAIPDIFKDDRVPIAVYRPTFVRSLLMTPIRQKDSIGAIGVYWSIEHVPSTQEREFLEALANATSIAMQNLELHSALEQKVLELEQAAQSKDQFLLMLSHELRTPMNSILGWSSILREESASLRPELRGGIESIYRNAQSEMRLIADLLDTSQIVAGRMSLQKTSMDLGETVRTAVQSARITTSKKSIRLNLNFELPEVFIDGDPDRLLQVLSNLLSNAAKFTPENGEIQVEMKEDGDSVLISVQDDGEGIESELLPKIFERFQSQSATLTRRHGGLGLGLAIVKSLVEAHGGKVFAYSAGVGRGARFEVRLPSQSRAHHFKFASSNVEGPSH